MASCVTFGFLVATAAAEAAATDQGGKGQEGPKDDTDEDTNVLHDDFLNVLDCQFKEIAHGAEVGEVFH